MNSFENYSDKLFLYDNINQAIEVYAEKFMEEQTAGAKIVHKNAAIKKIAATVLYAVLVFSVVSIFVFYHEFSKLWGVVILAVITLLWIMTMRTRFTSKTALCQKIKAMPDAEIDGILTSELDNSGSMLKGDSAGFSLCDKSGQEIMRVARKCAVKGLEALSLIGPSLTVSYRPTQRSSGGISRSSGHSIDYSGGSSNNNNNNNNH